MGNSSATFLPEYSCSDANLSRNSVTPEYWESSSISDDYSANSTATAVIILILLLIGLPANIIIIISIIYQRLYKETTHILLLNLAISDLLVCVLVMPLTIVAGFAGEYVFGDSDYTRCQVCKTGLIFIALTVFSVNVLGLISLDRFIFIKFPLRYGTVVTPRRVVTTVIVTWLLSVLQAVLPLAGFGEQKYAYTISFCTVSLLGGSGVGRNIYYAVVLVLMALVPIVTIVVTNIWIAFIVRRQIRKIYQLNKSDDALQKEIRRQRTKKEIVLMRAIGAIVLGNFVVWLPMILHVVLALSLGLVDEYPLGVYTFAYATFIMHSVLHPLIEGCFIPEIKNTFKAVLGFSKCNRDQVNLSRQSTDQDMVV